MSNKGGDFNTDTGLVFRFDNLSDRKAKEKWSLELTNELSILLDTLELCQLKGCEIDWDIIALTKDPEQDGTIILTINPQQEFIKIANGRLT